MIGVETTRHRDWSVADARLGFALDDEIPLSGFSSSAAGNSLRGGREAGAGQSVDPAITVPCTRHRQRQALARSCPAERQLGRLYLSQKCDRYPQGPRRPRWLGERSDRPPSSKPAAAH